MKLIELKKNESLNVPTRKVLVDFEHGYVFEPVYHKCNGLDTTQLNYTTVNRLDGYGFKQSPEEILAKINKPDNWNHLEDAAMNEHKGSELIEAVRELIEASYSVNVLSDTTLGGELFVLWREKVEKLLGD